MMKLTDREWKPFAINTLFERFTPGKCSAVTHLEKSEYGIEYIGATNHNNGVLCYLAENEENLKLVQDGNCIGFIKDGDGSAGYAIYKRESFVSTVNVIYGYASWLNSLTGLFFVGAQDMIKHKYSHGYKRNMQHLKADHVMLPADDNGQPDYQFMADYERQLIRHKREQYLKYVSDQLAKLGSIEPLKPLDELKWNPVCVADIGNVLSGHDIYARERIDGQIPYVTSGSTNNGIGYFVGNDNKSKDFGVISVNRNGAVGEAFYHPYTALFGNDCRKLRLDLDEKHKYAPFFIAAMISKQKTAFSYSRKLGTARLKLLKVMLPVNDQGKPDYNYMEQYIKNKMIQKYKKYLEYLGK